MQENLQARAGQERLKQALENKSEKPEALVNEMLRQGDVQVTDILSWIADQEEAANAENDLALMEELGDIKKSVNAAYAKLRAGLDQAKKQAPELTEDIDEGWGEGPNEATSTDANNETLEDPAALEAFSDEVSGFVEQPDLDCTELERFCAAAEKSKSRKELLFQALESKVGKKYARIISEDKEYRKSLSELVQALSGRLEEEGPVKMIDMNIANLMTVKEVVGSGAAKLVEAFNLKRYNPDLKHYPEGGMIMVQGLSLDQDSGEIISAQVDFGIDCGTPQDEQARIRREFLLTTEDQPDGSLKRKTKVNHKLLDFPPSMKKGGLAAKITRESMAGYDESGLDEIVLHANIDMGGYTWATYGYGWDEDAMAQEQFNKSQISAALAKFDRAARETFEAKAKAKNPNIKPRELQSAINQEEYRLTKAAEAEGRRLFRKLGSKDRLQLHFEKITATIKHASEKFQKAAEEAGLDTNDPQLQHVLGQFEDLLKRPETVTPQELALIGEAGPKLQRGKSGKWYTPRAFAEEIAAGKDSADPDLMGELHAGKIAMTGRDFDWYGKIELKNEGGQRGENRALIEKKINRADKKI
ncbi:MAG: hypothetical protein WC551_06945 [Patescibacteria group bacterium]